MADQQEQRPGVDGKSVPLAGNYLEALVSYERAGSEIRVCRVAYFTTDSWHSGITATAHPHSIACTVPS